MTGALRRAGLAAAGLLTPMAAAIPAALAQAAVAPAAPVATQGPNYLAIGIFTAFVLLTLGITYWAARTTKSTSDFYTAGGGITAGQNGLAIAGDYMSAASFLGISGLVFTFGFDGLIYSIGFLVGWPLVLFLIAERLRNLGKYTFADVAAFRLAQTPIRVLSAIGTLTVVAFYLIAQMVGAGKLIELLFGLSYGTAVVIVGVLMIVYVAFGGMKATTWVQIIKACLLLGGATLMAVLVLVHFGFNPDAMFAAAVAVHPSGDKIMAPGAFVADSVSTISLGIALMFGTAGLPHILMRFFTVSDAKAARKSVLWATGLIGYFYVLTFVIGFGAISFLMGNPAYYKVGATGTYNKLADMIGGALNMTAINLAQAVGGNVLFGFISAVAFATILAVVAGLTLAGASAVSHDLYASVIKRGQPTGGREVMVSKIAAVVIGLVAIGLGYKFENENVAFMVGLAFSVAASCNFPVLVMSVLWRGTTTTGALWGGFMGLATAVVLIVLSKAVWTDALHMTSAPMVPYSNPALFSVPVAFLGIIVFSLIDQSARAKRERALFDQQYVRSETGIGASIAEAH